MNINSVLFTFTSKLRRPVRVPAPALVAVLVLCCAGSVAYALVGNGYTVWSWGTTKDQVGVDLGPMSNRTCFLSGVAGNLNMGAETIFSVGGKESIAGISDKYPATGHYWLLGHGGAHLNQANHQVWDNNPVNAQATCFWTASGVTSEGLKSNLFNETVKVTDLTAPNNKVRQCFLSEVWGVKGAWDSDIAFTRVRPVTATDGIHKTTGWYLEAGFAFVTGDSFPRVYSRCADFPSNTTFTSGTTPFSATKTQTFALTSGVGVKACALTGISGRFVKNSWNDGIRMNPPAKIDGNWTLTATAGKTASWACAK